MTIFHQRTEGEMLSLGINYIMDFRVNARTPWLQWLCRKAGKYSLVRYLLVRLGRLRMVECVTVVIPIGFVQGPTWACSTYLAAEICTLQQRMLYVRIWKAPGAWEFDYAINAIDIGEPLHINSFAKIRSGLSVAVISRDR